MRWKRVALLVRTHCSKSEWRKMIVCFYVRSRYFEARSHLFQEVRGSHLASELALQCLHGMVRPSFAWVSGLDGGER